MSQNYYLYEKLAEAHRQDLLREAEQQRLVAGLPQERQRGVQLAIGTRGMLALVLALVITAALVTHFIVGPSLVGYGHPQAFVQHMVAWGWGHSNPEALVQRLVACHAWRSNPEALVQRLVA